MQKNYITKSAEETTRLGTTFGSTLAGGELILLFGDLGGGKTQFTKGIALSLDINETVISPTFTIERIYTPSESFPKKLIVHHFDLYRTKDDVEIFQSINELLEDKTNVVVVEWPENMSGLDLVKSHKLHFRYLDENSREINFEEAGL